MDKSDIEIIKKHAVTDHTLRTLYDEHINLEQKLEKFNGKVFLTPVEELERKNLQKMKLHGRDQIENILKNYRCTTDVNNY